ncbi:lactonase family protein [Nocardia harenae]|uniref:lactonase family protein n=1 Tax=Nocardia harenae TaxID=358707 RepID=UPI000B251299|nr:beta-propeller fold lactonase family protein [Nocardia harenae]
MKRAVLFPVVAALAVALGPSVAHVQAEPQGSQYVYVTGLATDSVARIDVSAGTAPRLVGSPTPIPPGLLGKGVAASPDGRYVYVGPIGDNGIAAFSVGADGTLTELPGSPAPSNAFGSLAVARDGKHLYATSSVDGRGLVTTYSINPDGLPVRAGSVQLDFTTHAGMMAVTPDGRNLYVADFFAGRVIHLPIGADGIAGEPRARLDAGLSPVLPGVSPDGKFLYLTNETTGTVTGFRIGADGALASIPGSPFRAETGAHGVTFSPDATRLYAPNVGGNNISGYRIEANGALTPLPGSPYSLGDTMSMPGLIFTSRDGNRVFAVGIATIDLQVTGRLLTMDVLPDGSLRPGAAPVDTGQLFVDGPCAAITP